MESEKKKFDLNEEAVIIDVEDEVIDKVLTGKITHIVVDINGLLHLGSGARGGSYTGKLQKISDALESCYQFIYGEGLRGVYGKPGARYVSPEMEHL